MDKDNYELNEKLNVTYKAAKEEGQVSAENLLQEIEPLLNEYFIGEVIREGNALKISLLNGQKFSIVAEEIN